MSKLSELLTGANAHGWSYETIAEKARQRGHSISRDTAWKYMTGRHGQVTREHLEALADVLSVPLRRVLTAADVPSDLGVYVPPDEARALTKAEREALDLLIRSMTRARGKANAKVIPFPDPDVYDEAAANKTKEAADADTTDKQ